LFGDILSHGLRRLGIEFIRKKNFRKEDRIKDALAKRGDAPRQRLDRRSLRNYGTDLWVTFDERKVDTFSRALKEDFPKESNSSSPATVVKCRGGLGECITYGEGQDTCHR